ncbi:MAG: calcium-binding protein [Actinomycetota bacterium]
MESIANLTLEVPSMMANRGHCIALVALILCWALPGTAEAGGPRRCFGRRASIVGTSGPDQLIGTPEDDVIVARGGADVIRGRGGGDDICAGPGADRVFGGGGADLAKSNRGNDRIFGQGRRDFLFGGRGNDHIFGLGLRDFLDGGPGSNTNDGGDGIDRCQEPAPGEPGATNCEKAGSAIKAHAI